MTYKTNFQGGTLSRRQFFMTSAAGGAILATSWPARGFAQDIALEKFLTLSPTLTGTDNLDEDIATAMLQAFYARGSTDDVTALLDGTDTPALENDIVAAWYSGVSPDPDALNVLTYTDARMWDAMTYTKPMGYCGGGMGYRAEPPVSCAPPDLHHISKPRGAASWPTTSQQTFLSLAQGLRARWSARNSPGKAAALRFWKRASALIGLTPLNGSKTPRSKSRNPPTRMIRRPPTPKPTKSRSVTNKTAPNFSNPPMSS